MNKLHESTWSNKAGESYAVQVFFDETKTKGLCKAVNRARKSRKKTATIAGGAIVIRVHSEGAKP